MTNQTKIDRRKFLVGLGKVLGVSAAASSLSLVTLNSALAYTRTPMSDTKAGKLFSLSQMQTLAHVCQTIIPKTDTPGAGDLDCHGFIDHQLISVHTSKQQASALRAVNGIDQLSKQNYDKSFFELLPVQQVECLTNLEATSWGSAAMLKDFKELKFLIAFGYFTSEIGATQVLNYQPVPGGYVPSLQVTAQTKNYGSLAFY